MISITNIPLRLDSDGSFVNWYLSPKQWLFVMQTQVIRLRAVETWRDEGGGKQPTRTSPSMCQPIESRSAKISGVFLWEKHRLLLKIGCKQIGESVLKPVSQLYLSTAALLTLIIPQSTCKSFFDRAIRVWINSIQLMPATTTTQYACQGARLVVCDGRKAC